jgi:hypothetical protein
MGSNFPATRTFLPLGLKAAENRASALTMMRLSTGWARQFLPRPAKNAGSLVRAQAELAAVALAFFAAESKGLGLIFC